MPAPRALLAATACCPLRAPPTQHAAPSFWLRRGWRTPRFDGQTSVVPHLAPPESGTPPQRTVQAPAGQCCLNVLRAGRLCPLCCRGSGDCACSGGWPRRDPGKRRTATRDPRPGRGSGPGSATTHAVAAAAAALVSAAASHRYTAMLYCTIQDKVEVGACWRARPGSWRRAPYGRRGSAQRTRPSTAARRPSAREGPAQTCARAVRCARNGGAARVGGRATAHRGVGQDGDCGAAGDCGHARARGWLRRALLHRGHALCKGHRGRRARTPAVCESPFAASRSKAA